MTNADHPKPCIGLAQVRQALNLLRYSSGAYISSLTSLALVEAYLAQPNLPDSPHLRVVALQDILIDLITTQLADHRTALGLEVPGTDETQATATRHIHQDAATSSAELIGWSWLYYGFVRCELAIRPAVFCAAAGIEDRTLRRYQHHVVWRLTLLLIAAERRARVERQR